MKRNIDLDKLLSKRLSDYECRPEQQEMADAVNQAFVNKKNLLVEAGTGVGKSFAYLIPAILSNEKTIVSTASIALQDQLINKDLVFLQRVIPRKFTFAILKGKNNYLCLKREREFVDIGKQYDKFIDWTSSTRTGDKDELTFIPDFWSKVCGETDDCNVMQCPHYGKCFYYRHYRSLSKKDILIINHHLLIYDLLSEFSILPFHKQLVIDEAHQIENIISHVFGAVLSHSRVVWLLYRLKGLRVSVDHLFEPVDLFFKKKSILSQAIHPIRDEIIGELRELKRQLSLEKIIQRLSMFQESLFDDDTKDRIETTAKYIKSLESTIIDFIEQADKEKVYYLIGSSRSYRGTEKTIELRSNLIESFKPFNFLVNAYNSLVMTSATLTSGGDFQFIKNRLGISDTPSGSRTCFDEKIIGSPFNFKRQALLYIDKDLPSPVKENSEDFKKESLHVIEDLINASKGRALVLFTSYSHLNFVSKYIKTKYPVKAQGDMPPARLINWFKKTSNSVLLATATFWQGIDIKGEKLSLVIIVKMPFGSPGDPVYDERCRRLGQRWFTDLALPSSILLLKQGFGRLIRGVHEYGVVAILDTRLLRSSYGKTIVSSLPETNIVSNIKDVKGFFNSIPHTFN